MYEVKKKNKNLATKEKTVKSSSNIMCPGSNIKHY